ncbi:alpha/beta hydrolase-fold protein [Mucilaginibacter sp. cycad4]|uniref:alpha/beta hydrolase n=1 Tax=Mucilaginibacter sp. cycad4 TaxID=3342096 RepID=UPI002AAC34CA|nr:alpha/beta hydrolase-fold protein [Mucilaginibacter gossypii]WPU99644.1 alpha/beta hydrolase-fold protein [Mucilaginibacter gossypii]
MKILKALTLILPLLDLLGARGFAQQVKPVIIPNSEHRQMHSKLAGNDYDIYIHYPAGYDTSKQKFPVLYVVDGDNDFSPSLEYLGLLMAEYHIPEPILVAIGDGGLIGTPGNKRNRDFTPVSVPNAAESGGAPVFLDFIEKELIPSVDAGLKTDPANRTLYGYSMGGLFATYTLFTKPTLFKNILIGSPALGYGNGAIFEIEKKYASKYKSLPVNVFMEVGGLETRGQVEPNKRLAALLENRHYENLVFKHIIIDDVTHLSGKPVTMLKALAWGYARK